MTPTLDIARWEGVSKRRRVALSMRLNGLISDQKAWVEADLLGASVASSQRRAQSAP